MQTVEEYIEALKEKKRVEEMNVTGDVAGYETPKAFAKSDEEHEARARNATETYGYIMPPKKKKKRNESKSLTEEMSSFMLMANELMLEAPYSELKNDAERTPKQKINQGIAEINRAIFELERRVGQYSRLKKESGVFNRDYLMSSRRKLQKISERLIRISRIINEMGE